MSSLLKRLGIFRAITIAMVLGLFLIMLSKLFSSTEYNVNVVEEHLKQAGFSRHHSGAYIRVTKIEDYGELSTLVLLQENEDLEDCFENQDRIERDGEMYRISDYQMSCPHYTIHIKEITKDSEKSRIPAEIDHVLDLLSP